MLHRLNRTEYANAIRDLFHIDVDAASLLPPDDSAYGFDNVSDVLGVSPSLQERYLTAAARISALAVGDVGIRPGSATYRVPQDLSQNQHVDGMPLGTIGGLRTRHYFPVNGDYDIQTRLYRTNLNIVRGLEYPSEFEVAIDGRPVHRGSPMRLHRRYPLPRPREAGRAVQRARQTSMNFAPVRPSFSKACLMSSETMRATSQPQVRVSRFRPLKPLGAIRGQVDIGIQRSDGLMS
jgi:hypothetical protein